MDTSSPYDRQFVVSPNLQAYDLGGMVYPLLFEDLPEVKSDEEFTALVASLVVEGRKYDRGYVFQASCVMRRIERNWIEDLWQTYAPYADPNFIKEFRTRFTQRCWELYLGNTFLNRGYALGPSNGSGPDFDVRNATDNSLLMMVEAIAVSQGTGEDRVPDLVYNGVSDIPVNEMSLRVTQALADKYRQYQQRLEKGVVGKDVPYVIAIDKSEVFHPEPMPIVLQVLYGIGKLTLSIPVPMPGEKRNWDEAESFYSRQQVVAKKNGEEVSSVFFLNSAHAGISAVVYSTRGILNLPRKPEDMGESFIVAHNPLATNPLVGKITFGEEWMGGEDGAYIIRPRRAYEEPDIWAYLQEESTP